MDNKIEIQQWELERLVPYDRNPRINDHAVDQIAAAIREYGFKVPIIIKSNGDVVDGHLRIKAAIKLDLATVPVVMADDLTEQQIKAFRISINRMAELAEWEQDLLQLELDELEAMGFDLTLTGFNEVDRPPKEEPPKLEEGWTYPTNTICDARKGEWQSRKKAWIATGIDSEKGRGGA